MGRIATHSAVKTLNPLRIHFLLKKNSLYSADHRGLIKTRCWISDCVVADRPKPLARSELFFFMRCQMQNPTLSA